jgi:hypothetical protein
MQTNPLNETPLGESLLLASSNGNSVLREVQEGLTSPFAAKHPRLGEFLLATATWPRQSTVECACKPQVPYLVEPF